MNKREGKFISKKKEILDLQINFSQQTIDILRKKDIIKTCKMVIFQGRNVRFNIVWIEEG